MALSIATPAVADELALADIAATDTFGDIPVVLSATRLSQPLDESPVSITVIDRQMIEASGFRDIVDLLRLAPGFVVGADSGNFRMAAYHGLSDKYARHLQVLVDGRSVYSAVFGGVYWSDLPLHIDDIERIEVIRGPNATTFGSNAFTAAINIITRHAVEQKGTRVMALTGTGGQRELTVQTGAGGDGLDYRITASVSEDEGFGRDTHDGRQVRLLTSRIDWSPTATDSVTFNLGFNGGPRETGRPASLFYRLREREGTSYFGQMLWHHNPTLRDQYRLNVYFNYYRSMDSWVGFENITGGSTPEVFVPYDENTWARRYDVELQHTRTVNADLRYVWGVEARNDQVRFPSWLPSAAWHSESLYRGFVNAERRIGRDLLLHGGLMVETHEATGTDYSPRAAVTYQIAPRHTLRFSASRAVRVPSVLEANLYERYCAPNQPIGSTGFQLQQLLLDLCLDVGRTVDALAPETNDAYEIGYLAELQPGLLWLDVKLFQNSIEHLISAYNPALPSPLPPHPVVGGLFPPPTFCADQYPVNEFCDPVYGFHNRHTARIRGLEAQINWSPAPTTRVVSGIALLDADAPLKAGATINSDDEEFGRSIPDYTFSALLMHRTADGWFANLAYYRVAKMMFIDTAFRNNFPCALSDPECAVPGYEKLDVVLGRKFRVGSVPVEVKLVAQDVLDDYYDTRTPAGSISPGNWVDTRYYASVSAEF